jgi:hypothetical protein
VSFIKFCLFIFKSELISFNAAVLYFRTIGDNISSEILSFASGRFGLGVLALLLVLLHGHYAWI